MRKRTGERASDSHSTSVIRAQRGAVPPIVNEVLRSHGQPLDPQTRATMESRFEHDFSGVRVHTDAKAAESSRAVNATAYTFGQSIAFDSDRYAPQHDTGRRLLAHELAHVVQQSRGGAGLPNDRSEQAAEQVAADFGRAGRIRVPGGTAPGLARQKAAASAKSSPAIATDLIQQAGRSLIAVNGVVIAESDAAKAEIQVTVNWRPDRLEIVIAVPEGRSVDVIEGAGTDSVLWQLSPDYTVTTRRKLKVPRRNYNELAGRYDPLEDYETLGTLSRQKPKSALAHKTPAVAPPPVRSIAPPTVSPPETAPPAGPPPSLQFTRTPPADLNLPPAAKYGRPTTDKQVGQERIDKIIVDAMAGRSGIPPPLSGMEPRSAIEAIKGAVAKAVAPLLSGLSKEMRELVLDKLNSAVEEGISGLIDAAVDTAKLDGTARGSIKKAVEAAIKLKPPERESGKK